MARKYTSGKQRAAFLERYNKKQNGCCAICGKQTTLVIDHNHATGLMRGLLCQAHNSGLGLFGDSPELLEAAAAYLREANYQSLKAMRRSLDFKNLRKKEREDQLVAEIIKDLRYPNDRARARALAELLETGVPRLQTKISRYRKMLKKKECN